MDPIYTTETMATRALAAEIRQAPHAFTNWIADRIGISTEALGVVTNVRCEAEENLDVVVSYGAEKSIGIEAKFDHVVTSAQLSRESTAVDKLVLLVLDESDAAGHESEVAAVATWHELLAIFDTPRLSAEDIDRIPGTKKKVERLMRALDLDAVLPEGWSTWIGRGDGGMSSIVVEGPRTRGGRRLCGQIQVMGRDSKLPLDEITLEYHVGVSVELGDEDFPEDPTTRPTWVDELFILDAVLQENGTRFQVRTNMPRNGTSPTGKRKMPIVREHLSGREWLAQGYCDWSLGTKSSIHRLDELKALADEAVALFIAWEAARHDTTAAAVAHP
ncbi:hypothetical protein [Clavibacter michiganensis]|uniref:hypothetical protein n=1 Tax=Clavibacter michiganensis TaxID=28447 RepID=UPI00068FE755|nr:hypothetical protein [Clavibacter michiganensis]